VCCTSPAVAATSEGEARKTSQPATEPLQPSGGGVHLSGCAGLTSPSVNLPVVGCEPLATSQPASATPESYGIVKDGDTVNFQKYLDLSVEIGGQDTVKIFANRELISTYSVLIKNMVEDAQDSEGVIIPLVDRCTPDTVLALLSWLDQFDKDPLDTKNMSRELIDLGYFLEIGGAEKAVKAKKAFYREVAKFLWRQDKLIGNIPADVYREAVLASRDRDIIAMFSFRHKVFMPQLNADAGGAATTSSAVAGAPLTKDNDYLFCDLEISLAEAKTLFQNEVTPIVATTEV
jgi:hypothetical protein